MSVFDYLDKKSKNFLLALGFAITFLVGIIDYLTGKQISFAVFYTIPVAMISWFMGLGAGFVVSVICSLEWLFADLRDTFTHPFIPYWNAIMRFSIFLLISLILSKLRITVDLERKARQAAALASRVKSEFLANMSHEIRTPMNAVIAMADLLAGLQQTPEGRKYVEILKMEGDHLLRLINDILDLSKVEAGQFEFEKRDFDLYQIAERLVSSMAIPAREKGLSLTYQIMPDVQARLVGDPENFRRILVNLIGNSIKFTEKGEIRLRIEKDPPASTPGHIRVSVSDTGIGIPPEKLDFIFERFTTLDPSMTRKFGGTGLGLNISKKLVEGMGGKMSAESRPGRGSTFYFTLPFEIPAGPFVKIAEPARGEQDWGLSLNAGRRPIRILLAEDIRSNRVIIEAFLKDINHELDIAENGEQAVQKFKTGRYDVVLMDIQMPVMDGYMATAAIREWELQNGLNRTPILALTAHALKEEAEKSLKVGSDAHLTKPLAKMTLLKNIHDFTQSMRVSNSAEAAPGRVKGTVPVSMDPQIKLLIPEFLANLRDYCKTMQDSLGQHDYETIRRLGHGIKGCGASYGFPVISDFGVCIENAAKNKNAGEIRTRLEEFKNYLENVEVPI